MFAAKTFASRNFAAATWLGAGQSAATVTLTTTWVFSGAAFASQALGYVVKDSDDLVIASGSATTDGSGVLTVDVPGSYNGQKLLIHVENVSSSMTTSGKVHGTQVATAA